MPEPIFEPGPVATPFVYTVSGTGEVVPRTCQAEYNGSGAGGDYIPAVIFRSQAGHVVSRAILQSTVTAGDDAEVSWFPGVKAAGVTAAAAGAVFARAYRDALGGAGDPVQTIPANSTRNASYPHTSTSDASVINWRTQINQNDTADLSGLGTYLVWATAHWDSATALLTSTIMDASQSGFPHTADLPTGTPSFADAIGSAQSQDYNVLHSVTSAISIHVAHGNRTGADHDVDQAYFSILYVPTA